MATDVPHRRATRVLAESLGKPSLWVIISAPWYNSRPMRQTAVNEHADRDGLALPGLLATCAQALTAAKAFRDAARQTVADLVAPAGKVDPALLEREQYGAHGFAWLATYLAALEAMLHWAERLEAEGALRELERLLLQAAFGEYLRQLLGGIALSQVEVLRPADMGLD